MVVLLVVEPDVPAMVTVLVPVVAVEDAVKVNVDVALPFAGGVTGLGENAAVNVQRTWNVERSVDRLETILLQTVSPKQDQLG